MRWSCAVALQPWSWEIGNKEAEVGEPFAEPTSEELETAEVLAAHLHARRVLGGDFNSAGELFESVERCYSLRGLDAVGDEVTVWARERYQSGEEFHEVLLGLVEEVDFAVSRAEECGELVAVGDGLRLSERLRAVLRHAGRPEDMGAGEIIEPPTPEELRTAEAIAGHLRAQQVLKGEFSSSETLIEEVERCYSSPGLESVRDGVTRFARQCDASGEDVVEVLVGLFDQVHREIAGAQERGELVRVEGTWCLNKRLSAALRQAQVRSLGTIGVKL